MSDVALVNTRVYVLGTTVDPTLYYYADASKTINVAVYDSNGSQVGQAISYNLNAGTNTIYLGDYLNGLNLSEGYYILKIGDFSFGIIVANASISTPTDPDGSVERIIVMHKPTSVMVELPPTSPVIPYSDSFMVAVYFHNNSKKLGKLVFYDGLNEYQTDWARKSLLKIELTFPDYNTMYQYLIARLNTPYDGIHEALGVIANGNIEDAVKASGLFSITPILGDVIDYDVDIENKKLTVTIVARLGFGFDKVKRALLAVAGGAVMLAGIGAGIAVAAGTGGVGTALGVAIAGAGIAAGLYILHKSTSDSGDEEEKWLKKLDYQYRQGLENVKKTYDNALGVLDYYHNQGQISDEAYNALKKAITDLYNTSVTTIKEIYETSKGCYDAGKKAGAKNKWLYAGGGLVGGLILNKFAGNKIILERTR